MNDVEWCEREQEKLWSRINAEVDAVSEEQLRDDAMSYPDTRTFTCPAHPDGCPNAGRECWQTDTLVYQFCPDCQRRNWPAQDTCEACGTSLVDPSTTKEDRP